VTLETLHRLRGQQGKRRINLKAKTCLNKTKFQEGESMNKLILVLLIACCFATIAGCGSSEYESKAELDKRQEELTNLLKKAEESTTKAVESSKKSTEKMYKNLDKQLERLEQLKKNKVKP